MTVVLWPGQPAPKPKPAMDPREVLSQALFLVDVQQGAVAETESYDEDWADYYSDTVEALLAAIELVTAPREAPN